MSGRKLLLVPESEWNLLNNRRDKMDVLSNIKHPIENSLFESAEKMKQIHNSDLPNEKKVDEHVKELNNFTVLKDKMKAKPAINVNRELQSIADDLPKTLQNQANNFLKRLQQNSIDWNEKGELIVNGKVWSGSNISDLVGNTLRNRKGIRPAYQTEFLQTLAALNFPEEYMRNKEILSKYRKYKHPPPGIYLSGDEDEVGKNRINFIKKQRIQKVRESNERRKKFKWLSVK